MHPITALAIALAVSSVFVAIVLGGINSDNQAAHTIQMCVANNGKPTIEYSRLKECKPPEHAAKLQATVKAVCDYTRTTDATEQACAIAQDASNSEYLCKENNANAGNICQVELK